LQDSIRSNITSFDTIRPSHRWETAKRSGTAQVLHHPLVQKAYACAATVHGGNVQLDGSKRLEHLEKTALTVSSLGLDAVAVAAALLHKVLDDSGLDDSTLRTFVGEEVTDLVAGVSKASRLCKMYTEHRDLQDEVGFVACSPKVQPYMQVQLYGMYCILLH
jgi:(p)ppGpp synthase/HD superfamily hydrolase